MAATAAPPSSSSSGWLDWAAEYTKAAQAEARPPPEWAARVAAAAASAAAGETGDVPWSAGLAEVLAGALLSGGGAAAWKYAEAALVARLASPALLIALSSPLGTASWLTRCWRPRFPALRRVAGWERRMRVRDPGVVCANARSVTDDVVHPKKFRGKFTQNTVRFSQCCFCGLNLWRSPCRVIPQRFSRPTAYRLYLELLRRHGFNFHYQMKASNFKK
ncbi:hypothetical protein PR202_ga27964 [Eleusine coracana subsp. coracana]|uniref:Uncharacterized protein n=1 Tax=Eleusine coracana subsp. coracana TaxID=191504 RepID=A0AAV5DJ12_ELECO|nr:hypothetical protein PR202_ga27964 [Eleusine coracana subsp. coracana]